MHARHGLHVRMVIPEEAERGVAEFWVGGRLFGFTHLEHGELVLRIEPRDDSAEISVNARSLAVALAEAQELVD